jgi:hypothetical protein
MTTREMLLGAADLIDERGLAHGTFCDRSGGLCVRGAIMSAADSPPAVTAAEHALATYLDLGDRNVSSRIAGEVSTALRATARGVP